MRAQGGPGIGSGGNGLRRRRLWQWAAVGAAAPLGQGLVCGGGLRTGTAGPGTGSEMAHGREAGHRRAQIRGGTGGNMDGNENEARPPPPPPPPPHFFYIEPWGSRRVQGSWKAKFRHCCEITAALFSNCKINKKLI